MVLASGRVSGYGEIIQGWGLKGAGGIAYEVFGGSEGGIKHYAAGGGEVGLPLLPRY